MTDAEPIVLWVDNDLCGNEGFFMFLEMLLPRDSCQFKLQTFTTTDEAVEFILANAAQIFLVIQDSYRERSAIIEQWKAMKPTVTMPIGWSSADFYTYAIDSFAPNAGVIFAGYGFDPQEESFIKQWAQRDSRILWADKWDLINRKSPDRTLVEIAEDQLARWRKVFPPSEDLELLQPVADELAVLCGMRPERLSDLTPRQFEELIGSLFKNQGFEVELTAQTRDGGYDIVAVEKTGAGQGTILVEVKHFAPHRPVGVGIVRALYGVKTLRGAEKAILATSSYVSRDAKREFSRVIPWQLDFLERESVLDICRAAIPKILDRRLSRKGTQSGTGAQP